MEQSVQVLQWQAEGEKRGEKRGRIKGRIEGRIEGEMESKIELLLRLLQLKFLGPLPAEVVQRINQTADVALIDRWFDDALTAAALHDFLLQMAK